ncbi:hypothetical protein M378DRAFT_902832 [Amanita muscaria Koide BX008]|uniref:DUF6534 domain-containing protein n=1 Tax=Amanita muscaria (strain Koide BX008) TaxID=946122 RepID=A0A0C2WHC0_AMAMK|nr:hypothetical protein M378DRAFT_902832 [Amanita muscaria Koide BX008]
MISLGFIFAVAADIGIMITLFVLLRLSRQQSISLNNVIDQLILYTLEIGSLTAFMAIAIVITWFTMRRNALIFLAIYVSLEKAYAIAFLGSLNTRYQLRRSRNSQNSHGQNMATRVQNLGGQSECIDISSRPPQIPKRREGSTDIRLHDIHVDVTRSICNDDV